MFKTSALAAALGLTLASAASATVVFSDDFDYGTRDVLNVGTPPNVGFLLPNWTAGPTVDYIYTTGFTSDPAGLCREGAGAASGCIDLDGSTFTPGLLTTVQSFAAGTYTLAIELFGNNRGAGPDDVTITLGSWSTTISNILSGDDASGTFTFTTTGGTLSFQNSGGDNVGAVLSSVSLAAVPLPAGGLLLIAALGGLALLRRRKTV